MSDKDRNIKDPAETVRKLAFSIHTEVKEELLERNKI